MADQHPKASLAGIRWTGLSAAACAGLSLVQVPILARLLTPADFGSMAVVMSVMAFAQTFSDVGISRAIVQAPDITDDELSSLYWVNVLSSVALSAVLFAVGYLVAYVYGQPRLHSLLSLTAVALVVNAIGLQPRVVAQKELRFGALAAVEVIAAGAAFVAAVVTAYGGLGVYSIVCGTLASGFAGTFLSWTLLARGWRPSFRLRLAEVRRFLAFGAYLVANDLANTLNAQIDVLLGGQVLSASRLGFYNLPKTLALRVQSLVNPMLTKVGFPVMALVQHDPAQLRRLFLQTLNVTASLNFPIYVAMAVFAEPIVRVVFGPQWVEAAPTLRVIAAWAAVRSTANPIGSLLLAKGRADLQFRWNAALVLLVPPCVWIGSGYGPQGVATALLIVQIGLFFASWYFLIKPLCGASFLDLARQFSLPLVAPLGVLGAGSLVVNGLRSDVVRLGVVSMLVLVSVSLANWQVVVRLARGIQLARFRA